MLAALENTDNHHQADGDKDDDRANFDQREPILRFAEALHRDVVQQEDQPQEQRTPDPTGQVGEPIAHH